MDEYDASYLCIEKLINAVQSIRECLLCAICMEIFKEPVTLKCGHKFCKNCILTVTENENACCPFCNIKIQKRSIPKKGNQFLQFCVNRFNDLVQAITFDSGIDVLKPYNKVKNTKESQAFVPKKLSSKIVESSVTSEGSLSSINQQSCSKNNFISSKKLPKKNTNNGKKCDNTLHKYLASTSNCTNPLKDKIKCWLENIKPNSIANASDINAEAESLSDLKSNKENQLRGQKENYSSTSKTINSIDQDIELSQESKYKETQMRVQEAEMFLKNNKSNKIISDKTVLKTPLTVPAVSHSDACDWRRIKKVGKEMQAKTFKSLSVSFEKGSHTVVLDDTVPCNSTNNDSKNISEESNRNNYLANDDSILERKQISSKWNNNFNEKNMSKSIIKENNCGNHYLDTSSSQIENISISNINAKQINEIIGTLPLQENLNTPEQARNISLLSNKNSLSKINQLSPFKINADIDLGNEYSSDELSSFENKTAVNLQNPLSSQFKQSLKKQLKSSTSLKPIHFQPNISENVSQIENIPRGDILPDEPKSRLSLRLPNLKTSDSSLNQNMSKSSWNESNKRSQKSHRPLIIFKKLGKIFKRRKDVPFYYLGKMKPKELVNNIIIKSDIPVNIHYKSIMLNANVKLNENNSIKVSPKNNGVKMLSPEKDSQLKFLAIESPHQYNTCTESNTCEKKKQSLIGNSTKFNETMENNESFCTIKKISKRQLDFHKKECDHKQLEESEDFFKKSKTCQSKLSSCKNTSKEKIKADEKSFETTSQNLITTDNIMEIYEPTLSANINTYERNNNLEIIESNEHLSPVNMEVDRLQEDISVNSSTSNIKNTETNTTCDEVDNLTNTISKQDSCIINIDSESNVDSESSSTYIPNNWKKSRQSRTISRNILSSPKTSPLKKKRTHSESSNDDDDVSSIIDKWSVQPVKKEEPLIKKPKFNLNIKKNRDSNQSEIECSNSEDIVPDNSTNHDTKQLEPHELQKDLPINRFRKMKSFKQNDTGSNKMIDMPSSLISADLFESNEHTVQSNLPISPKLLNKVASSNASVSTDNSYKYLNNERLISSKNFVDGTLVDSEQFNENKSISSESSEGSNKENSEINKTVSNILPVKKCKNWEDNIEGSLNHGKAIKNIANQDNSYHISDSLMNITQEQVAMKKIEKALIGADLSDLDNDKNREIYESEKIATPCKKPMWSNSDVDSIDATPVSRRRQYNFSTPNSVGKLERHMSQILSPQKNFNLIPAITPLRNTKAYPFSHSTPISNTPTSERRSSKGKKMTIICSGLLQENTKLVQKFAKKFKTNFQSNFNKTVSHVIVQTDNETKIGHKTFKYIQGIAFKKYVVSLQWIMDCLDQNKLLDENNEKYDVLDPEILESGSKRSRISKIDIFQGFAFFCLEPFNSVALNEFKDILLFNGATIATSLMELSMQKDRHRIIILESENLSQEVNTVGRPKTMYSNASSTTQRRKRSFINSVCTDGEIFDIAERKLRLDGKSMEANLLKQIAVPTDASEIADNKNNKKSRQMSAEAALSLIIEGNLTKFTYTLIRKVALEHGHDLYPSYNKVCNAINNASSQMCFICKISISEMNDIENMSKKVLKEKRVIMAAKKKEIQHGLRNELGINVDEPTHGSGNTNDGNTARTFFNNIDVVSRVTELSTLKKSEAVLISFEWAIDCISQYQILPLSPYLYESSREEALVLGIPSELLIEEETVEEEE